ncbi:MAG TPA: EAL domain-containing protein [Solirubrobacteraceae bacterium]|nr:EAL domain-containing protein [Solirubrobacteraceae bacterium]
MVSCTLSHATPRMLLRAAAPAPALGRAGIRCRTGPAAGLSSPAGLHRRPWLGRLRRALERELFVVHYQPIVSLRDGRVAHYEALVRLADERTGPPVPPGRFLPAAERYGLIREIDRFVLDAVAELLAGDAPGDARNGPRIALNLSALSLTDPTMLTRIERTLERHAVAPSRLAFELTETAAITDMERARSFCAGVRALGCAVALDDFGAGFGSFQYLKQLPFDYLKIDGGFVRALPSSPKDQLVVQALVGLAQGMGKQTIAEYVGDRHTLGLLRRYGVDYAQGFEIGRPHPALSLAEL